MGFSIKDVYSKAKNLFTTSDGLKTVAVAAGTGGMLPGYAEGMMTSDKFKDTSQEVMKGLGNLVTGGYIAQNKATDEARKARNQAQEQYAAAESAAKAEAERLSNLEEERKKRLALYGTGNPATLMGSYLGVTGQAQVGRATLG